MLDVIAAVEEEFAFAIELNSLRWLVNTIGSLKVLLSTLGKLSLRSVDYFVQVVHLAELSLRVSSNNGTLRRGQKEGSTRTHCNVSGI